MSVTFTNLEFPNFEWTSSSPKIDLVLPYSPAVEFSWNQREGFARALIDLGMLNQIYWVWDNEAILTNFFNDIKHSSADFILIMCCDHHQVWLHNTEQKRDFWRKLKVPSVCHSIERIIDSPFPDTLAKTKSALRTFDAFIYIDELADELFVQSKKPALWVGQYVDETVFKPYVPFNQRTNKVFFRGKIENYGIERVYKDRRRLFDALSQHPCFEFSNSSVNPLTMLDAAKLKASYRFVINLPATCTGYSASLHEALASRCVVFQYKLPREEYKSRALFKDNVHFISYDKDDTDGLIKLVQDAIENYADYEQVAQNGYEECLTKHTIKKRILEVVDFINANWQRLSSK